MYFITIIEVHKYMNSKYFIIIVQVHKLMIAKILHHRYLEYQNVRYLEQRSMFKTFLGGGVGLDIQNSCAVLKKELSTSQPNKFTAYTL